MKCMVDTPIKTFFSPSTLIIGFHRRWAPKSSKAFFTSDFWQCSSTFFTAVLERGVSLATITINFPKRSSTESLQPRSWSMISVLVGSPLATLINSPHFLSPPSISTIDLHYRYAPNLNQQSCPDLYQRTPSAFFTQSSLNLQSDLHQSDLQGSSYARDHHHAITITWSPPSTFTIDIHQHFDAHLLPAILNAVFHPLSNRNPFSPPKTILDILVNPLHFSFPFCNVNYDAWETSNTVRLWEFEPPLILLTGFWSGNLHYHPSIEVESLFVLNFDEPSTSSTASRLPCGLVNI